MVSVFLALPLLKPSEYVGIRYEESHSEHWVVMGTFILGCIDWTGGDGKVRVSLAQLGRLASPLDLRRSEYQLPSAQDLLLKDPAFGNLSEQLS